MNKTLCTLILIVNKDEIYRDFLMSLKTQKNILYEVIKIDNLHNQYKSAREAYNAAASKAKGKYLIFLHPDIRFLDEYALFNVMEYVSEKTDFGIIGIAGSPLECVAGNRVILSNMVHGKDKKQTGKHIKNLCVVQTVDECFFIIEKNFFLKMPFPKRDGWHLYAVEQCLLANKVGKKNYVVPAHIWHLSDGQSLDYRYVIQVKQLINEYRNYTEIINTTVKKWYTRSFYSWYYVIFYICKQWIKGVIKRFLK